MKKNNTTTQDRIEFLSAVTTEVVSHSELAEKLFFCLNKTLSDQKIASSIPTERIVYSHSPKRMIEFLRLFSLDDDFKWYTHKWDISKPFDIDEQINIQNITKSSLSDMAYSKVSGPIVNINTYNQVWNFINFQNSGNKVYTWTNTIFEYIREGWHSIIDLSHNNPMTPIENLKLDNGHQFIDYIRMFKASIEFRTDLNDDDRFSERIWKHLSAGIPKDFDVIFNPNFDEIGYEINIYCDVVGILSALNIICSWITKHKSRSSKVIIDLHAANDYYILEIFHVDSYFNNLIKLEKPSGDFANLRKRLFSVCDFSMEGDFINNGHSQGSLIVNGLDADTFLSDEILSDCNVQTVDNIIGGVKYKLKIYRK